MKIFLKAVLIFFAFTLEITIHAQIIKSPEACNGENESCVIKNISDKTQSYQFENMNLRLGKGAILRISFGELKLLTGEFFVECLATCMMSALYIDKIQVNLGSLYFRANVHKNEILGISGDIVHKVKSHGRFVLLPTMLQTVEKGNLLGSKTEMPHVISDLQIKSRLSHLTKNSKQLIQSLSKQRRHTIDALAEVNKQIINRKINNHKDTVKRKKIQKKQYGDESYRLRLLFRKKNSVY